MLKFNKLLLKTISLIVAITFSSTATLYGIELPNRSNLRVPSSFKTQQGEGRIEKSLYDFTEDKEAPYSKEEFSIKNIRVSLNTFDKKFTVIFKQLESYKEELRKKSKDLPVGVLWFVTNYNFFVKEIRKLRSELKMAKARKLPDDGEKSYRIAKEYVEKLGFGTLTLARLTNYIDGHSQRDDFSLSDLDTIPTMLKLALLEKFLQYFLDVEENRNIGMLDELKRMETKDADDKFKHTVDNIKYVNEANFGPLIADISSIDRIFKFDLVYLHMDERTQSEYRETVREIAELAKTSEQVVAMKIMEMAKNHHIRAPDIGNSYYTDFRPTHIGYYLVDEGRKELERLLGAELKFTKSIKNWIYSKRASIYSGTTIGLTVVSTGILATLLIALSVHPAVAVLMSLLAFFIFNDTSAHLVNGLVNAFIDVEPLPKMNFWKGVPKENKTLIAFHTILSSEEQIDELIKRLERTFIYNADENIPLAVLADPRDSNTGEISEKEKLLIAYISEKIDDLNAKYQYALGVAAPFYYFHRGLKWNERLGKYFGWERKRGKLEELNSWLLDQTTETSFIKTPENSENLKGLRYVLTLDEDTEVPAGMAKELIETMAHPLNRPVINPDKNIVEKGYGMLYPWLGIIPAFHEPRSERTWYRQLELWKRGQRDIEVYKYAFPDVHQFIFKEGTFSGKGIYDIKVADMLLKDRFPQDRILSHDYLEGAYLRAALKTDATLLEGLVVDIVTDYKRRERWERGDWQDVPWMLFRVPDSESKNLFSETNPISLHNRWKVYDKVRRSLTAPITLGLIFIGWLMPQIPNLEWTILMIFTTSFNKFPITFNPKTLFSALPRISFISTLDVILLPFSAYYNIASLYNIFIRENLIKKPHLAWVTAAQAGQAKDVKALRGVLTWAKVPLITLWVAYGVLVLFRPELWAVSGLFLGLWTFSPLVVYRMAGPELPSWIAIHETIEHLWWILNSKITARRLKNKFKVRDNLTDGQKDDLKQVAVETWKWFETYVNENENFLPPDNTIHVDPDKDIIAHYTSPTNIGLYLVSIVSAWDLGFIDTDEALKRTKDTLATIQMLEKWNGQLYNYYDTRTLVPLRRYISVVDSGNFAASLLVVAQAFKDKDTAAIAMDLFESMDFSVLYDPDTGFFYTGYDEELTHVSDAYDVSRSHLTALEEEMAKRFQVSYYDMLISEARIASFIAIAKGDAPPIHWFSLKRMIGKTDVGRVMLSWSGTAFEFLMPQLFMKEKDLSESWLGLNNLRAVMAQITYAEKNKLPFWGISESAYPEKTPDGGYYYKAFGTPRLGASDEKPEDVIAPYASILGLEYMPLAVWENLNRLTDSGVRGKYGFYDSVDVDLLKPAYTFMSHHQGMSLIALNNYLNGGTVRDRFHANSIIGNVENLLREDSPDAETFNAHRLERRWRLGYNTKQPEANLLGNEKYVACITNKGSGFSMAKLDSGRIISVTRRDEGSLLEDGFRNFYIKDEKTGELWSLGFNPKGEHLGSHVTVHEDSSSTITNTHRDIKTEARIFVPVADGVEICQITLTNALDTQRSLSLTSYLEWLLENARLDKDHPAYNRLFVHTEHKAPGTIFAYSRKSDVLGFHSCVSTQPDRFETSRKEFIGRGGSLRSPRGLYSGLSNSEGYTFDAIASLQVSVELAPFESKTITFLTGVAENKKEAGGIIAKYSHPADIDKALQKTISSTERQLYSLGLSYKKRAIIKYLTSRLFYKDEDLLGNEASRKSNQRPAQELGGYGLSSERPFTLIKVSSFGQVQDVATLVKMNNFLRSNILPTDLVILNTATDEEKRQRINRALQVFNKEGVFLFDVKNTPQEDIILLETWANIVIVNPLKDLVNKIRAEEKMSRVTDVEIKRIMPVRQITEESDSVSYGSFSSDGKEFIITTSLTPRPWTHILANPYFGSLITNSGGGYLWYLNSQQNRITPFKPDQVVNEVNNVIYIKDQDTGEMQAPTVDIEVGDIVRYGLGYATFENTSSEISTKLDVFVPPSEPVEVRILNVRNDGKSKKILSIASFVDLVLGNNREDARFKIQSSYDPKLKALFFTNGTSSVKDSVTFSSTSLNRVQFETEKQDFIGVNRDLGNPVAMEKGKLTNTQGINNDAVSGFLGEVDLEPGEEKTVVFILGQTNSKGQASQIVTRYQDVSKAKDSLEETKMYWKKLLEAFSIKTTDDDFNNMVNYWLKVQAIAGHMWARTGYYQSGGAIGFRDQLQTALNVGLYTDPQIARDQIILHSAHQFKEGDVQHWWHPETNLGVRSNISDSLLWLPYALYQYINATGDNTILGIETPYLKGEKPALNEEGRVFIPEISEEKDPVYKHALKTIDYVLDQLGPHGLPLMKWGDWNDGLDNIGREGKGESVWLAFFLYDVLVNFSDIVEEKEGKVRKEFYLTKARALKDAVEEYCWDGEWYIRAFDDDGNVIGSKDSAEWNIDLLVQSWAVISGAADSERARKAIDSALKHLVDGNLILLGTPPYESSDLNPGKIKDYPPGVRENGGQYTHAAAWFVLALAKSGQKEKAYEIFKKLLPTTHARDIKTYEAEPYVVAADVYSGKEHKGRAGWTWYTGSAGWLLRAAIDGILGIRLENNEFIVPPVDQDEIPGFDLLDVSGKNKIETKPDNFVKEDKKSEKTDLNIQKTLKTQL